MSNACTTVTCLLVQCRPMSREGREEGPRPGHPSTRGSRMPRVTVKGTRSDAFPEPPGAKVNGTPPGRGAGGGRRTRPIPEPGRACLTHALHALLRRGLGVCPRPHTSGAAGPWRKASQLHHRILRTHWPSKLCRFCVFVVFCLPLLEAAHS